MEPATLSNTVQSNNSTTANQKLQRAAIQLLGGFNREMIARELGKKRKDKSPTYTPDALKKILRESFYKRLATYHSDAPAFDAVYKKAEQKLDELVDGVAASMK